MNFKYFKSYTDDTYSGNLIILEEGFLKQDIREGIWLIHSTYKYEGLVVDQSFFKEGKLIKKITTSDYGKVPSIYIYKNGILDGLCGYTILDNSEVEFHYYENGIFIGSPILKQDLISKKGILYSKQEEKPYTGLVFETYVEFKNNDLSEYLYLDAEESHNLNNDYIPEVINGNLKSISVYKDGILNKISKEWDKNGKLIK